MPIYKAFQCAVRCVVKCAVKCAVRCAANVLLLVATADTAAGGVTGALSADLWQHFGRVHSKRLRRPKTAAPSAGQRAQAAEGYGARAVSDCA